ncbi:MAG TPA: HAD family phosphatase [Streptosporangiaceae bacterium]|jgi:putative hydrolase of the HAD superfamily|nr:HAD family phosphatase [Streptosporangiaceae bacterium]
MRIRAVGFDIGSVLERIDPIEEFHDRWRTRLAMTGPDFDAALASVDPDGLAETGGLTEAQYLGQYAAALGLSQAQRAEFTADLWDWYCGELDTGLVAYAASLRPRVRTGILSNSADGARREEQARYRFEQLVDVIVYSHEAGVAKPDPRAFLLLCDELGVRPDELAFLDDVPGHIDAARALGIHGIVHVSTPASIAAIEDLLGQGS